MGGRGAASANYPNYGSEYKSIHKYSNIKFIFNTKKTNTSAPLETRTKNRVYVTLEYNTGKPHYISYYDTIGKRFKTIDYHNQKHFVKNGNKKRYLKNPHRHSGYYHDENKSGNLTTQERKLVANILQEWRKNVRTKARKYIYRRDRKSSNHY